VRQDCILFQCIAKFHQRFIRERVIIDSYWIQAGIFFQVLAQFKKVLISQIRLRKIYSTDIMELHELEGRLNERLGLGGDVEEGHVDGVDKSEVKIWLFVDFWFPNETGVNLIPDHFVRVQLILKDFLRKFSHDIAKSDIRT